MNATPHPLPRQALRALAVAVAVLLGHALLLGWVGGGGALPVPRHEAPALQVRRLALPALPAPPAAPLPEVAAATQPPPAPARRRSANPVPQPHLYPQPAEAAPPPAPPAVEPAPDATLAAAEPPAAASAVVPDRAPEPAASAVAEAPPWPVYPTQLPAPAELHYELRRGALAGSGVLRWQVEAGRYELVLEGRVLGLPVLEQASRGALDADGLAPERFADRRRGRDLRAVNFQREAGKITWSASTAEAPLARGAQDRLSWMVQLTAIAAAQPLPPGRQVVMQVAGLRGEADTWAFTVQPDAGDGLLHLLREPRRPYDTRVEVWLDPRRGHWPARALQTVPGGDTRFELRLAEEAPAGGLESTAPGRN